MHGFLQRLRFLLRRRQLERELAEELESHRAMVQDRLEQSGMSAQDAAPASRRVLGNVTLAREDAREVWMWPSLERLAQDVRYGARMLLKQKTFAATAIATLAIGIGTTTAMMSVVGGELWRPLPFSEPDRLAAIHTTPAGPRSWDRVTGAELLRWQAQAAAFEAVAALSSSRGRVLRGRKVPESVRTLPVTANFFTTLGWSAALGRVFEPADELSTEDGRVVVLSHTAWVKFFDSDPSIVGRSVVIDDHAVEVVGVFGPRQRLEFTAEPDIYTVISPRRAPETRNLDAIARLKPGVPLLTAQDELIALERRDNPRGSDSPARGIQVGLMMDANIGYNWRTLYFFLGASVFVLLLSCANVANLLLARTLDRHREFAIRGALGGGRAALARQLMVESLWIAVPGTAAGVLLASWTMQLFSIWLPPNYLIRGLRTELDTRAALFALVACAVTTLVFGLVPILFNRVDLNATLTRTSRGIAGSTSQQRARKAFVVAEVVLAFVLVFAAGLFFNSFLRLRNAPLGFEPDNRLAMGIVLSGQRYSSPESVVQFADRLIEETKAIPGVVQAAMGSSLPLGSGPSMNYSRTDRPTPPLAEQPTGPGRAVSIDYFRAFNIRIVAGRSFTLADAPGAPHVAVINETLARALFGTEDAVGREIVVRPRASLTWLKEERHLVVGVAQNSKDVGIHEVDFATVYLPLLQHQPTALQLVAHTSVPASAALIEQVRHSVLKVDPTLPVLNMNTMAERVNNATRSNRFHLVLLGAFAAIAIMLAAIGLYGSIAYATERRIPELALRHALGAQTLGLLMLIVRQAVSLGVVGVVIGVGAAFAIAQAIGDGLYLVRGQHEGLIYGVTTTDPLTLFIAAIVVTAITIAAGTLPARRAVGVDPATVLRAE